MRVAALCDIHANLPALDAVLRDVRAAGVDLIVFGGDIVPGPMMRETFTRILGLDIPTQFIYGNGELGMLAQINAPNPDAVTYWGTTAGTPLPEPLKEVCTVERTAGAARSCPRHGWMADDAASRDSRSWERTVLPCHSV